MPCEINDFLKNCAGIKFSNTNAGSRFDQFITFTGLNRLHEFIGDGHTEVEVIKAVLIFLGTDKIHDIRMINPQNPHIGSAAFAPLFDGFCGSIKHSGKRKRT